MERVGLITSVGVAIVGGAIAAAARWAPEALQPAAARAQLARLLLQAVNEADAFIADGTPRAGEPAQVAERDESTLCATTSTLPEPALVALATTQPPHVCVEVPKFEFKALGSQACRMQVVVHRSWEGVRAEPRCFTRDFLKRS
jgi:hypothetical protein